MVLLVVAVVAGQRLLAVGRIVGRIDIQDDEGGWLDACADEGIDQEVIDEGMRSVRARYISAKAGRSSSGKSPCRRVKAYWKRASVLPEANG